MDKSLLICAWSKAARTFAFEITMICKVSYSLHLGRETNVFHEGQILQDHMRRRLGFWSGRQIGSIKKHSPLFGTCVTRQTITIASSTLGIKGMSLERAAVIWSIYRLSKETTIEPSS